MKSQSEENDLQRLGRIKYHLKMSGLLKLPDVQTGEEQSRGCGCGGGRTRHPCEQGGDEVFSSISRINCISVLEDVCVPIVPQESLGFNLGRPVDHFVT